eukprot:1152418-Pelagomonas_calceolata.AAC.4
MDAIAKAVHAAVDKEQKQTTLCIQDLLLCGGHFPHEFMIARGNSRVFYLGRVLSRVCRKWSLAGYQLRGFGRATQIQDTQIQGMAGEVEHYAEGGPRGDN